MTKCPGLTLLSVRLKLQRGGYGCNCSPSYLGLNTRNCQSCRLSVLSRKRDARSHVTWHAKEGLAAERMRGKLYD